MEELVLSAVVTLAEMQAVKKMKRGLEESPSGPIKMRKISPSLPSPPCRDSAPPLPTPPPPTLPHSQDLATAAEAAAATARPDQPDPDLSSNQSDQTIKHGSSEGRKRGKKPGPKPGQRKTGTGSSSCTAMSYAAFGEEKERLRKAGLSITNLNHQWQRSKQVAKGEALSEIAALLEEAYETDSAPIQTDPTLAKVAKVLHKYFSFKEDTILFPSLKLD